MRFGSVGLKACSGGMGIFVQGSACAGGVAALPAGGAADCADAVSGTARKVSANANLFSMKFLCGLGMSGEVIAHLHCSLRRRPALQTQCGRWCDCFPRITCWLRGECPPWSPGRPGRVRGRADASRQSRSEEHTSELQSRQYLVCRLLLEKK